MSQIPPLSIEEKLIYRNVKRAAILWLLMMRLDPRPVTESDAAEILQIDRGTARKYFKALVDVSVITRLGRYDGFILSESGRQMVLPLELRHLAERAASGKVRFAPSDLFNNTEEFKEEDIFKSLLLIKGEGEIPTLEGEIPTFGPENAAPVDKPVEKPVDNLTIDEKIDLILAKEPERREILTALLESGIKINDRTIGLLTADDITPHEIRSQYEALKSRGYGTHTGILITNLESKYRPKGAEIDIDTGHPPECTCHLCIAARNRRFLEQYTDWNVENE